MSTHRVCCCDEQPVLDCTDSCFLSSYLATNINGSYTVEKSFTLTEPCICAGGDDPGIILQYQYTVEFVQNAGVTWTRYTNPSPQVGCCYYAQGEMTCTVTGTLTKWEYDCITNEFVCLDEQPLVRTRTEVPFCLTATCETELPEACAYDPGAGVSWLVSLEICDFPVKGSYESCGDASPIGIVCGGAVIQWRTALKSLGSIFGYERGLLPAIARPSFCTLEVQDVNDPTNCLTIVAANQNQNGPFALYAVDEFSFGQDEPAECSLGLGTAFAGATDAFSWTATIANDCAGDTWSDPPCWGIECNATSGCIEARQSIGVAYPNVS